MNKLTLTILLLMLLSACNPNVVSNQEKPVVSVSILPQQYFIEQLAGDRVEVNVMIPPGASPATYEPTVSQLSQLNRSAVYMKIGYLGFELAWMDKIRSVNPSMQVVDLSRGIKLIHGAESEEHTHRHDHGGTDPHIWMSARNARIMASSIFESLCVHLPDEIEMLTSNLSQLLAELDSLDYEITEMLSGLVHRSYMIYHPALSYFARDYNLEQLPMELEGKTPSPAHMKLMADLGKEHHITTIFLQMQFDQKNTEALAREIGAEIVQINPLDSDWYKQMLFIATRLKSSL